jgi:5'-3' exonuclease
MTHQIQLVSKPAEADFILAVDVSNLAYRSAFAHETLFTSDGRRSGHVYGSVRSLMAVLQNELEPGKWCLVFCYDGLRAKEARQAKVPTYKAKRDPNRYNPIPEVEQVLRLIPGLHIKQDGKEGDDALAWITNKCQGTKKIVLLTGDRDLWALMSDQVRVFSPNLKRYVTPEDVVEHYGVLSCQNISLCKALFGDASDDIVGIPRLQKRQVRPTIDVLSLGRVRVTIDNFLASIELTRPLEMTEASRVKILQDKERLRANYSIILPDLEGWIKESVVHVPTLWSTIEAANRNRVAFEDILKYYECYSLMEYVPYFMGSSIPIKGRSNEKTN